MNLSVSEKKFDAIVCLSAIDWDFLWQRTQEIMTQFAAMGYPVLFVENTGVRTPGIKDLPRVWNRLKKVISPPGKNDIKQITGVEIFSPRALPFPYHKLAVNYNASLIQSKIMAFSRQNNIPVNRILLWTYMTTPMAVEIARRLQWAGVVVDLVSDPCKVKGAEAIIKSHKKMLQLADLVICASRPVMEVAKRQLDGEHPGKLFLFEDGFSTRLLNVPGDPLKNTTEDNKNIVAAYIGGVNKKIWWDAVDSMASGLPEASFVFAGPKEYNDLPCKKPNMSWIPPFSKYTDLGVFLKGCRVGLIPYVQSSYVAEMRPAKINEYLVMGLPVVSTRMPELERFAQENGEGIIYLADTPSDFADKLRQALDEDCAEYREKRRQIAANRSWETVCCDLSKRLNDLI